MKAVVVGGSRPVGPLDEEAIGGSDLVVAVDAGAEALWGLGVVPHLFVGDMDSVSAATAAEFARQGVETLILPPAKDETDTEAALCVARKRGADDISVFGVLGGPRLDHLLAAVFLLESPRLAGACVRLLSDGNEIRLSSGKEELVGRPGDLISLLPLDATVQDVRTDGLEYALRGETLRRTEGRGVSNVLVGDRATVEHGVGRLLIAHYRETRPVDLPAACQFSLYPLEQGDIRPPIEEAIQGAAAVGVAATVGRLSTFLEGEQEQVFGALAAAFTRARRSGPTVMVAIVASGAPSAETVASIQAGIPKGGMPKAVIPKDGQRDIHTEGDV